MKAITVRQPWAWAIQAGLKTVENRTVGYSYRGLLAIHAGSGWSKRGARDPRIIRAIIDRRIELPFDPVFTTDRETGRPALFHSSGLMSGALIAITSLDDVHPEHGCCQDRWGEASYTEAGGKQRTEIEHLVLEDIQPLKLMIPLIMPGRLGLWNVTGEALAEVIRQTRAT